MHTPSNPPRSEICVDFHINLRLKHQQLLYNTLSLTLTFEQQSFFHDYYIFTTFTKKEQLAEVGALVKKKGGNILMHYLLSFKE